MAAANVAKRINSKIETKNAVLRFKNGSLRVINREKLNEKFIARIKRERHHLLDKRRDIAEAELRRIASDVLQDEWTDSGLVTKISSSFSNSFDLERELLLEEDLEKESLLEYENWLQGEIDNLLSSEEQVDDCQVVCPVCCQQCFTFSGSTIECSHCSVSYPLTKSIDCLRADINATLVEHNDSCSYHPQFATVPDSGGRNCLLILCHTCSYLNVLL